MNRRRFLSSVAATVAGSGIAAAAWSRLVQRHSSPIEEPQLSQRLHDAGLRDASHIQANSGWPQRLGPTNHSVSTERGLIDHWPDEGPPRLWSHPVGTGYSSPVVTDRGLVLFHREGNDEVIECFAPNTGEPRWRQTARTSFQSRYETYNSGPYSTPLLTDSQVFAWGAEGLFRCLDLLTGDVVWQRPLSREFEVPEGMFAVGSSPCLDENRLLLNVGGIKQNAGLVALDAATGETLWRSTDHGASYATPVTAIMHGQRLLFAVTAAGLVCLEVDSGFVRWSIPFGVGNAPERVNAVSPLVWQDLVLATSGPGPGNLCVRVLADGSYEEVWKSRRAIDSQFNNQICLDGFVYGYTSKWNRSASVVCVDIHTGELRWEWASNLMRGSGLAADGKLILFGEHGHLALLRATPDAPAVLSQTSQPVLTGQTYASPALHRGRLFLRNDRELLCLDLRSRRVGDF